MAASRDKLASLSVAQREGLLRKLQEKKQNRDGGIKPCPTDGPCPASFAQEIMWLSAQLIPEQSTAYSVPIMMRLRGRLRIDLLQTTLNSLVQRHQTLRTTVDVDEGLLVQRIAPPHPVDMRVIPVDGASPEEREENLHELCVAEARKPFVISTGPMFRAVLLQAGMEDHLLVMLTHHICFDGWSRRLLLRDFEVIYTALHAGAIPVLQEMPVQYADFAVWQREQMQGETMQRQISYWKNRLEGAPQVLHLPTDRPRPAVQSFRGARMGTGMLGPVLDKLTPLKQSERTTLFVTLLAAFNVLLFRYTGQNDILVGTPVLGRMRPELEHLIGYFSNTLVIRTDLSGDPTFRSLLRQVRSTVLSAFDHQEMPLEKLIAELQPERSLSRSPLFQVMFSLGDSPPPPPTLPDLEASFVRVDRGAAKLDLILGISADTGKTSDVLEYNTDLFDADTIQRMLNNFRQLLESIAADPDQPISALSMVDPAEYREILSISGQVTSPAAGLISELIERQAANTPNAPAAVHEGHQLTYKVLNERANQLAHYLISRGAKPGSRLGFCLERSLDLAVAMLAVLKTGAAAVPIDPSYPADRLRFLLEDSGISMLLTTSLVAPRLPATDAPRITVDSLAAEVAAQLVSNPVSGITADQPAYVIYTSGSTGEPKGVLLPHRGLVNHQRASISLYGITPQDRVLQFSSISFDIALEEIFPAWIAGGTVVFRPEDLPLGGPAFLEWISVNRITVLDLPTAFWHEWTNDLAAIKAQLPTSLRLVIVGGEKAQSETLRKWSVLARERVRWVNTYGPTEASVIATAYEPVDLPEDPRQDLPIGKPIANVIVRVLDNRLQMVPIGVGGELFIGGIGLAQGYLNRPELTDKKFISDPFSSDPSALLYRTGDLARYLADGNLEFLGRIDHQIKIRGYRVEPGEIENLLSSHPGVHEALVLAREHDIQGKFLVAYVVPQQKNTLSTKVLRGFLESKLPAYMMPSSFILLGAMPLTPNGKIDRKALPAPVSAEGNGAAMVAPRTETERKLVEIWQDVLGIPAAGVTDSFFDLGGHSLLAIRLMSRIEYTFKKRLAFAAVFQHPTIEKLAAVVQPDQTPPEHFVVPIQPQGGRRPFFCVNGYSTFRPLASYLGLDQPFFGIPVPDGTTISTPYRMEEVAAKLIRIVRSIQPEGPYVLGGWCLAGLIAYEMAQQLRAQGQEVTFVALFDVPTRTIYRRSGLENVLVKMRGQLAAFSSGSMLVRLRQVMTSIGIRLHRWFWLKAYASYVPRDSALWDKARSPEMVMRMAAESYKPKPFDGSLLMFRPLRQATGPNPRENSFWRSLARGGLTSIDVPGDHISMFNEQNVGVIAEQMLLKLSREPMADLDSRNLEGEQSTWHSQS